MRALASASVHNLGGRSRKLWSDSRIYAVFWDCVLCVQPWRLYLESRNGKKSLIFKWRVLLSNCKSCLSFLVWLEIVVRIQKLASDKAVVRIARNWRSYWSKKISRVWKLLFFLKTYLLNQILKRTHHLFSLTFLCHSLDFSCTWEHLHQFNLTNVAVLDWSCRGKDRLS